MNNNFFVTSKNRHKDSVLNPPANKNGKLIIVDFDKNEMISHPTVHNGFNQKELKSLLSDAGF